MTASFKPWTPAEDAVIRARYFTDSSRVIARDLRRSMTAVFKRAARLGLMKNRPWTDSDRETLRLYWGEMSLQELAAKVGRTVLTTYWRAQHMGLPLGCPQGHEYLWRAGVRTGYGIDQLRRILRWAGVTIKRSMARPTGAARSFHVVVPFDVDAAIARWHETEPLFSAAQRRGVSADMIAARLRLLPGVPARPGNRKHWRLPSDLIDRALTVALPPRVHARAAGGRFARAA